MLEKLDKRTSVSQQVAPFLLFPFPILEWWKIFPFSARQKQARITQKKTRFSHNEGEYCGEKTRERRQKNNVVEKKA